MEWCSIAFLTSEIRRAGRTSSHDETVPSSYRFSRFFVIDTESLAFDTYKVSSLHTACDVFRDRRCLPLPLCPSDGFVSSYTPGMC